MKAKEIEKLARDMKYYCINVSSCFKPLCKYKKYCDNYKRTPLYYSTSELAQATIKADIFYTEETNGLGPVWEGPVFMNPPYSMPEIGHFTDKLLSEDVSDWIVLTNNSSDTSWFHKLAEECSLMCFTRGRVGFLNVEGEKMATRQGQCFFYKGDDVEAFKKEFSNYGLVIGVV
jgi:hypothetical protein